MRFQIPSFLLEVNNIQVKHIQPNASASLCIKQQKQQTAATTKTAAATRETN